MFESRVRTLTDRLVKAPVVALIEFVVIKLELLIFVDVIFVVCNVPKFIIFPLIVWFGLLKQLDCYQL